ncbi:hypothetical protein MA16_Dca014530 [Dendrobium catenatum]|uniref:Uncharacterized protein n=1 Tax=Dendrobium catenatum TaxID=906689 RepID=A0A2I0VMP0_9ASPA|nr:hypothetical protein MA16_Dca014530 [Dendrobium catenatum]
MDGRGWEIGKWKERTWRAIGKVFGSCWMVSKWKGTSSQWSMSSKLASSCFRLGPRWGTTEAHSPLVSIAAGQGLGDLERPMGMWVMTTPSPSIPISSSHSEGKSRSFKEALAGYSSSSMKLKFILLSFKGFLALLFEDFMEAVKDTNVVDHLVGPEGEMMNVALEDGEFVSSGHHLLPSSCVKKLVVVAIDNWEEDGKFMEDDNPELHRGHSYDGLVTLVPLGLLTGVVDWSSDLSVFVAEGLILCFSPTYLDAEVNGGIKAGFISILEGVGLYSGGLCYDGIMYSSNMLNMRLFRGGSCADWVYFVVFPTGGSSLIAGFIG